MRPSRVILLTAIASALAGCADATPGDDLPTPPGTFARDEALTNTVPGAQGVVLGISVADGDQPPAATPDVPPDGTVSCPPACDGRGRPVDAIVIGRSVDAEAEVVVQIAPDARVYRRVGDAIEPIEFGPEGVRRGMRASAWLAGGLQESYPARGTATVVVVEQP